MLFAWPRESAKDVCNRDENDVFGKCVKKVNDEWISQHQPVDIVVIATAVSRKLPLVSPHLVIHICNIINSTKLAYIRQLNIYIYGCRLGKRLLSELFLYFSIRFCKRECYI